MTKALHNIQRRSLLLASATLISCKGIPVNAQTNDEAKQLLLAIKRVIDEDLIDKPVQASEILGLQISDYRGPNEDVRPVPIVGQNRLRQIHTRLTASAGQSDQKQRIHFGQADLSISNFRSIEDTRTNVSPEQIFEVFGRKFIRASSRVRPMYRPDTDFSTWSGDYQNETLIYGLPNPGQTEMLISLDSKSFLSDITLRMKRRNGDNK